MSYDMIDRFLRNNLHDDDYAEYSAALDAVAAAAVAAERERWRGIAHRVAADANRYGCEGLQMRCTISDTGALVSWEVGGPNREIERLRSSPLE